jgi:hypothetical protein
MNVNIFNSCLPQCAWNEGFVAWILKTKIRKLHRLSIYEKFSIIPIIYTKRLQSVSVDGLMLNIITHLSILISEYVPAISWYAMLQNFASKLSMYHDGTLQLIVEAYIAYTFFNLLYKNLIGVFFLTNETEFCFLTKQMFNYRKC